MMYSLPFRKNKKIVRCSAPFHKMHSSLENCIDFYMPENTPVLAIAGGIISKVIDKYSKNYKNPIYAKNANIIRINHKNGEYSEYVHLKYNSARVKNGEKVRRGQVIALSGMTGYSTYPHLHFGIYKGKKNIKPRLKGLNSIGFKSYKLFE